MAAARPGHTTATAWPANGVAGDRVAGYGVVERQGGPITGVVQVDVGVAAGVVVGTPFVFRCAGVDGAAVVCGAVVFGVVVLGFVVTAVGWISSPCVICCFVGSDWLGLPAR